MLEPRGSFSGYTALEADDGDPPDSARGRAGDDVQRPGAWLAMSSEYELAPADEPPIANADSSRSRHDRKDSWSQQTVRTVSREGSVLRHPAPDLQAIQGAYLSNVERLEESAERLSLGSSIEEEVRRLREQLKLTGSRQSSLHQSLGKRSTASPSTHSIVEVNSIARSGGFSPEAHVDSPEGSFHSRSWQRQPRSRVPSRPDRLEQLIESSETAHGGIGRPPLVPQHSQSMSSGRLKLANPDHDVLLEQRKEEACSSSMRQSIQNIGRTASPEQAGPTPRDGPPRSASAASGDTYRRNVDLFADFDGVHAQDEELEKLVNPEGRPLSPYQPPHVNVPASFESPPTHQESMVYYPAPVPMMLNLPPKLSKFPTTDLRDLRRSQLMAMTNANKPRGSFHQEDQSELSRTNAHRSMANLPAHLKANLFFEQLSVPQHVEVKDGSAMATLDSILDASAFAPVSAFTDHPIVGHAGADVYAPTQPQRKSRVISGGKTARSSTLPDKRVASDPQATGEKRRSSFLGLLGKRSSSGQLPSEAKAGNDQDPSIQHIPGVDDDEDNDDKDNNDKYEDEQDDWLEEPESHFNDRPTTLLAEIQLRKLRQQTRNRTAATAFPNGMRSTLLQLDAVEQIQRKSRNQRPVTLAWEGSPDIGDGGDEDDVPLGVLFQKKVAGKAMLSGEQWDDDRPLGLIQKRQLEDNEPLTARRARLRGEDPARRPPLRNASPRDPSREPSPDKRNSQFNLEVPGLTDDNDEQEGNEDETLAQRKARLEAKKAAARQTKSDLASEVLSHFDNIQKASEREERPKQSKTPDPEETLGQRRRRLQTERLQKSLGGSLGNRLSMADLLQAHPSQGHILSQPGLMYQQPPQMTQTQFQTQSQMFSSLFQSQFGQPDMQTQMPMPFGNPLNPQLGFSHQQQLLYPNPLAHQAHLGGYSGAPINEAMGMGMGMTGYSIMQDQAGINQGQRDMIDRWREGVMYS